MSLERRAALSIITTLRPAVYSLQQAVDYTGHSPLCPCDCCAARSFGRSASRSLHSTPTSYRQTKPKVVLRDDIPSNWAYTGTKREIDTAYRDKLRAYRMQVAVLRNEWRPLVKRHNEELQRLKQERDEVRLAAQEEDLNRQYDRWKVPTRLRTSQQIRDNPDAREFAYARHALRTSLSHVSRVAQAEVLLRDSATWIEPEKLDEAIEDALDNPTDLFLGGEPWHTTLEGVPEYVEGFEGPQVERELPEFVVRKRKKNRKKPAPSKPAW